jgi:nucleoid-associated protein YgaU
VGKDYKIGLICGLVAAVALMIWMATLRSLNPLARMREVSTSLSREGPAGQSARPTPQPPERTSQIRQQPAEAPRLAPSTQASDDSWQQKLFEEPQQPTHVEEQVPHTAPATEPTAPVRYHVVQRGENLSTIAQQYYGSANAWRRILNANQDRIANPDRIAEGTRLVIP